MRGVDARDMVLVVELCDKYTKVYLLIMLFLRVVLIERGRCKNKRRHCGTGMD